MPDLLRSPLAPIRRVFRQQAHEQSRYYENKRVEGRNFDGTISVRPLTGECVERSNICTAYDGQIIQVPCGNGLGNLGAAGSAMARTSQQAGTIWVESLDPNELPAGLTTAVTVIGRGFRETSVFEFLRPGTNEVNDDITIDAATYISETEFELQVAVAADADLITDGRGGLAYDNPGAPL